VISSAYLCLRGAMPFVIELRRGYLPWHRWRRDQDFMCDW
jgi:hypothetical protein